jgi:hypothetical protein
MSKNKKDDKAKRNLPHLPLKPKHPHTKGAPDDHDPEAQYEAKDSS